MINEGEEHLPNRRIPTNLHKGSPLQGQVSVPTFLSYTVNLTPECGLLLVTWRQRAERVWEVEKPSMPHLASNGDFP